jgi:hypothetical protein
MKNRQLRSRCHFAESSRNRCRGAAILRIYTEEETALARLKMGEDGRKKIKLKK